MKRFMVMVFAVVILMGSWNIPVFADDNREINAVILIDGSHLMNKRWGKQKRIEVLKKALPDALDIAAKTPEWGYNVGIRIFGDQSPLSKADCADLRLGVYADWINPGILRMVVESVKPKGMTCLSNGLFSVQDDFTGKNKNSYSSIVAIVSGRDACKKETEFTACDYLINSKHAADAVHFIGLNLSDKDAEYLAGVAKKSNGYFVNVKKPDDLKSVLINVFTYVTKDRKIPAESPATETTPAAKSKAGK